MVAQSDVEASLRSRYEQKILMLRNFYQDGHLQYDSTGVAKGNPHPGSWTVARLGITKVRLKPDKLEVEGTRIAESYETKLLKFVPVRTSNQVRITIDRDSRFALETAVSQVFLDSSEKFVDLVPSYWKAFVGGQVEFVPQSTGKPCYRIKGLSLISASGKPWKWCEEDAKEKRASDTQPESPATNPVFKVGDGITAPTPLHTPDPSYLPLARQAGIQGTTVLQLVVTEQGTVDNVQIVRPQGFGLDDVAVEAVKTWTFKPALRNGQPVPVQISVEVNFRLT